MDATGNVEGGGGGASSEDRDRSNSDEKDLNLKDGEDEDPNLLIVCIVVALLLLLLLFGASLSLLCLYKRHRHRLNCFSHNSTIDDADTDRLRRLTTGSDQASTSAPDATPIEKKKKSGEQTGSRLIPKFLFSSARSTNQSATGSGSYGTIPTSTWTTCPVSSGIGFPVPTKVSYVLLSNKSVESPESNPTSPEVADASRPPNDPNSRIRNRCSGVTGSQPGYPATAATSRRSKVMGALASRGSNPNASNLPPPSSPCRIVVDTVVFNSGDDDPSSSSDLNNRFIVDSISPSSADAASAAATAESRRSSYSSVVGGFGAGDGGATDAAAASRRGSMSPRERTSIPFLWTLGPSSSAPSVGKEDSFWVPPTVLLKKRANSLAPPSLTITSDVDTSHGSHHNGTAPRRSESVGRSGGGGGGGGDGTRGGPGQSNSAAGRDMSSLTCSSTDRLSEMWPSSGEWTNGQQQQQQQHPHPHHQQQLQQQQQRRRRASMQDALDFTKIDASLYERPPPLSCSQKLFGSVQEENLGSVHFSLTYDADLSVLTVRLMQAMDLSIPSPAPPPSPAPTSAAAGGSAGVVGGAGDGGGGGPPRSLNPFARLRLLPDERNVLQSRIHPRTLCPQFEEEFVFESTPTDLPNRTLELMLMNDEHGGGGGGCSVRSVAASLAAAAAAGSAAEEDEGCFGHVLLPLDQVDFTEPTTFLKGISAYERKPEPESYLGDIMFSLSYLPSAERMTVVIAKARHLKQADLCTSRTPPINPFVKVVVFTEGKKVKKKKTTTKRGSVCPEWNEALVFGVAKDLLGGVQLEFLVLSENLLGTDDTIGKVVLGARSTSDDRAHWNDFLNGKPGISRWHRLVPSDA